MIQMKNITLLNHETLNKVNIFKLYSVFIISFILISAIFSRTGTGLYIFQFRLGEILLE